MINSLNASSVNKKINMRQFSKVDVSQIKLGIRFTAPVFFDDGKNMFLAEGKTAKNYHIQALKRWKIPFLLTFGKVINEGDDFFNRSSDNYGEVEELEELESLED